MNAGVKMNVFPNPTTGLASVRYEIEEPMEIQISILNIMGQEILRLPSTNYKKASGSHTQELDLSKAGITSGIYVVKLTADRHEITKKLSVLR